MVLKGTKYASFFAAYCDRCGQPVDGHTLVSDGYRPELRVCPECYDPPSETLFALDPDEVFIQDYRPRVVENCERDPDESDIDKLLKGAMDAHKRANRS